MLRKIRIAAAVIFCLGITLLLLDFTGTAHRFLGWMAKVQFLPALLALNVGVVAALVLLTLVCGRVYCSVICPLGVFQDAVSHVGTAKSKAPYKYHKENKWLRYGVLVLFVAAMIAGVNALVALLAPYSAYGRMVQNLLQPLYLMGNNALAYLAERVNSYAFYSKEVWIRSIPTFIIAVVTLVIIVALSFKGGRTYCNSICPVGTTLSFFSRFAMFRPVIDTEKCKHCKACELHCKAQCISISKDEQKIDYSRCVDCFNCIDSCKFDALQYKFAWKKMPGQAGHDGGKDSQDGHGVGKDSLDGTPDQGRRAFFAGTAIAVGAAALKSVESKAQSLQKVDGGFADVLPKAAPEREVPITPPGSKSVKDFYSHCTGCQLCVAECPNDVLRPSARLEHLMQPEMSFENGYCRPECTRCSEVCPAGAILPITKEEKTRYHIGLAHVDVDSCISATGKSECGKCSMMCPTGAIRMIRKDDVHIPVVAEEMCIGCGACEQYCPVRPISAITVNGRYQHV